MLILLIFTITNSFTITEINNDHQFHISGIEIYWITEIELNWNCMVGEVRDFHSLMDNVS